MSIPVTNFLQNLFGLDRNNGTHAITSQSVNITLLGKAYNDVPCSRTETQIHSVTSC